MPWPSNHVIRRAGTTSSSILGSHSTENPLALLLYLKYLSVVKLSFRRAVLRMASTAKPPLIPSADLESFTKYLQGCNRILALLGAGLSASSGLPTFRGAGKPCLLLRYDHACRGTLLIERVGGLWRSHDAMSLATPEAFNANPGLVWQFYSYRRHMALQARPNKAHLALAELARQNENFVTLTQNVDGALQLL